MISWPRPGRMPAHDIILLLDTHRSGASNDAFTNDVIGALNAFGERPGIVDDGVGDVDAGGEELSRLEHGVFTSALLDTRTCSGAGPLKFGKLAAETERRMGLLLARPEEQSAVILRGGSNPRATQCK